MATVRKPAAAKKAAAKKAAAKRSASRLTTASGKRLTAGYEAELAAEAEAGFDVAALGRRPAGRPSLTGRPGKSRRLDLRVDDKTLAALQLLAEQQHRPVSEVVREALRRFVEAS